MASTLEHSSPSSSCSDSDEYTSFPTFSIDAFLPVPACASPKSEILINQDVESRHDILGPVPYTQHFLYPNTFKPVSQLLDDHDQNSPNVTLDLLPAGPDSATSPSVQPQNTSCQDQSGHSYSHSPNKHCYRPNHPSFVKFPESLPLNKPQLHGLRSPHPRCISNTTGTEALISLAWTGEISSPIAASGYAPSRIGDTYMWPKLRISDTEVIPRRRVSWPRECEEKGRNYEYEDTRRLQQSPSGSNSRLNLQSERWTLANVISDDRVTDETLVELLEELRLRRLCSTERSAFRFSPELADETSSFTDKEPPDENSIPPQAPVTVPEDVTKAWSAARRAILVCRELVLTERHYLTSLHTLLKGETQSPPPPLMMSRIPALIDASSLLLDLMEINPSVLGVCATFLQVYEQLERAFIQWCEVVGQFFTADPNGDFDMIVKRSNSAPVGPSLIFAETALSTKNVVGSWGRKIQSRANLDEIASMVARSPPKGKARYRPLIRDLAILPTQRITRYVLLFKDLSIHSPPFDVKPIIEHAAEAATTLAAKADRAQNHIAFHVATSP